MTLLPVRRICSRSYFIIEPQKAQTESSAEKNFLRVKKCAAPLWGRAGVMLPNRRPAGRSRLLRNRSRRPPPVSPEHGGARSGACPLRQASPRRRLRHPGEFPATRSFWEIMWTCLAGASISCGRRVEAYSSATVRGSRPSIMATISPPVMVSFSRR
jgi:hypothetical protein